MQKISSAIDLEKISTSLEAPKQENMAREQTAEVVNKLFREMSAIFPAFRTAWPTEDDLKRAKVNWVKAFQSEGINTIEQLRFGLQKCRKIDRPFAPSCGEFISWCKPEAKDLGLPPEFEAYNLAVRMSSQFSDFVPECENTHTVLRHVLQQIGIFEFRSMIAEKAKKTFGHYYAISCQQFVNGELAIIPKALPQKIDSTQESCSKDVAESSLRKIKEILGK